MELEESGKPTRRLHVNIWWVNFSVIASAATAYILAVFGYLPVNPTYAIIMGAVFGTLFVLYQLFYFREMGKRIHPQSPEPDGELM